VLAELARGRLGAKLPALREALEGRFGAHHGLLVGELLARIDQLDETIGRLSAEVACVAAPFSLLLALLVAIPGVSRRTAEVLLAEIGSDMGRFPTAAHLASWAGVCPGNHESAGKHGSGRTRKGSKWLRVALVEAAHAAARTKSSYLAAQYARLRGRRGPKKAALAVAHSILWSPGTCSAAAGLYRPGRRRLRQAPDPPGVEGPAGPAARAHGPQGHPGANSGLTTSKVRAGRPLRAFSPEDEATGLDRNGDAPGGARLGPDRVGAGSASGSDRNWPSWTAKCWALGVPRGRLALAARVAHSYLAVWDVPCARSALKLPAPTWPTTSLT
jgi:Transposase IS116/IS110/IS902 family